MELNKMVDIIFVYQNYAGNFNIMFWNAREATLYFISATTTLKAAQNFTHNYYAIDGYEIVWL
jgi:hypothetical protein